MTEKKPTPETQEKAKKSPEQEEHQQSGEKEIGGFKDSGLKEPTRFGDWEVKGRCSDF